MRTAFALSVLLAVSCNRDRTSRTPRCVHAFCVQEARAQTAPIRYNPKDAWIPTQQVRIIAGDADVLINRIYLQVGEAWGAFADDAVRIIRTDPPSSEEDPFERGPWIAGSSLMPVGGRGEEDLSAWGNHGIYIALRVLDIPI